MVCIACETFYNDRPPIPKHLLEKALRLILQETRSKSTNGITSNRHGH